MPRIHYEDREFSDFFRGKLEEALEQSSFYLETEKIMDKIWNKVDWALRTSFNNGIYYRVHGKLPKIEDTEESKGD